MTIFDEKAIADQLHKVVENGLNEDVWNNARAAETPPIDLLISHARDVLHELKILRRENEILRAKVDTFDKMMIAVCVQPPVQSGYHQPDVAWALEKLLNNMTTKPSGPT